MESMKPSPIKDVALSKLIHNVAFRTFELEKVIILKTNFEAKIKLNEGTYAVLKANDGSIVITPIEDATKTSGGESE